MNDCECPYCGADVEICHDDCYGYEEDQIYEDSCSACGKNFAYTICLSVDHYPYKADCLNGSEHDYKSYGDRERCRQCGEFKPKDR